MNALVGLGLITLGAIVLLRAVGAPIGPLARGLSRALLWLVRAGWRFSVLLVNVARGRVPGPLSRFRGGAEVLAPGDSAPRPNRSVEVQDYRGTAREGELAPLFADGVPLGRFERPGRGAGRPLALPLELLERNCAIVGSTGSGKTASVVVPWIEHMLVSGVSVVTVDVKGDLFDRLEPAARAAGVRLWHWSLGDPVRSASWNFMSGLGDTKDVESAVRSIIGAPRPGDPQPFFHERDYRWLRALIQITQLIHGPSASPRELYRLVAEQDRLVDAFRRIPGVRSFEPEVSDLLRFSTDEHSRAVSGLLNALHLFNAPHVARITERSDFTISGITFRPTLLVIGAPLSEGRASEVLSAVMLGQLFNVVYRRFSGAPAPSLYFVIDEAARLRDRIAYEEVLAIARSARAALCLAFQDVTQMGDERTASALLANCSTIIMMRGASPAAARYLSSRLGQRTERSVVETVQRGPFDIFAQRGGTTQQVTCVPVLGEREIMHPPFGPGCYGGVVLASAVSPKPFLVDFTRP